jgi:uncharacterized protein
MPFTPGLYRQPQSPVRPAGGLARGDIPVLMGYARKGPSGMPVRIHSLSEFEEWFGPPLNHGFLWHSVKGFFENGGATAYAMRIAPAAAAKAASVFRSRHDLTTASTPALTWKAEASFPWMMLDPRKRDARQRSDSAIWVQLFEQVIRDHGPRSPDAGAFGNSLMLRVTRTSRARTETFFDATDPQNLSSVKSLSGLEAASILELSQAGSDSSTHSIVRIPFRIDALSGKIIWKDALPQGLFDLTKPIRIASIEFDVSVFAEGQLLQQFAGLSPNPDHSMAFARVLPVSCRALDFTPHIRMNGWPIDASLQAALLAQTDWADELNWPPEGDYMLSGGVDALDRIVKDDWLAAIGILPKLGDAAMLAAPDIVLPQSEIEPLEGIQSDTPDCGDLSPIEPGFFRGRVTSFASDGSEVALPGVTVDVKGKGNTAITDDDGMFLVSDTGSSLITLQLSKPGFEPLEFQVQPFPYPPSTPFSLTLTPITSPKVFVADEIAELQSALGNPAIAGPYKIAFADPPSATMLAEDLLTWRARLGDSQRTGFFAPWLNLPSVSRGGIMTQSIACPPSGHVAGAFAAAERSVGIHRTGANMQLRHAESVTLAIDDAVQEGLNPAGVNAIRALPGRGIRIFGTRSLSSDPEWRYLTTRRIVDAIEKSLEISLRWMVFEPNNLITRHSVETSATILLDRLFRQGILAGPVASGAYSARCNLENNDDATRADGKLVVDIGVAPTKPFEFIFFRLGHEFEATQVTER